MTSGAALGSPGHPLRMQISKRFFVSMLTRDIELEDAILDLLDNCLDGVVRSTKHSINSKKPYRGFWSKITIGEDRFEIFDNCGGIPSDLIERAFGIGRTFDPNQRHRTIGVYGIGMKRALFKMALEAKVESHSTFGFQVTMDEQWLSNETNWRLDYHRTRPNFHKGTRISISRLRPEIANVFQTTSFRTRLQGFIARHYAVILGKGFRVEINTISVEPAPISILVSDAVALESHKEALAPYMLFYETPKIKASLWVGMYRSPPETEGAEESETEVRQSSDNSGWTIVCNDRAIVSNDTTILTGWGEAGVPRFHPQFIGIRGILVMESDYPLELPLTTTKRGIDAASTLYLTLKEYMREGTKVFTSFTNHWKSNRIRAKKLFEDASLIELPGLRALLARTTLSDVKKLEGARRYYPHLPTPTPSEMKRIAFSRHQNQISAIGRELLENTNAKPSDVGAACFDEVYKKVSR